MKPKLLKSFDADADRKLGKKKKTIKLLGEQTTNVGETKKCHGCVFIHRKDTLQFFVSADKCNSFNSKAMKLGKGLGIKNSHDSRKQALCGRLEQRLTKIISNHLKTIWIVKSDTASSWLTIVSENKDYHRSMLKQDPQTQSVEIRNWFLSSTSVGC